MAEGEGEGALARWSRLKRAAAAAPASERTPEAAVRAASLPAEVRAAATGEGQDDPAAALPPVEGLRADSDYTAFLREGVPDALRRVALRRAWATDPAIAGFRGFAEYDWDCNAPGYGALRAGDDLAKLCDAILRPPPPPEPAAEAEAATPTEGAPPPAGPAVPAPPPPLEPADERPEVA